MAVSSTGGAFFKADSDYFDGSFTLNQRVTDMTGPLKKLESKDLEIIDKVREHQYGKFVHMQEHDSHMAELWEPVDDL